jgi:hypothetical protein
VFIVLFIHKAFQSQIKEFYYVINLPKYTFAYPLHLRKGMDPVPEAMFFFKTRCSRTYRN